MRQLKIELLFTSHPLTCSKNWAVARKYLSPQLVQEMERLKTPEEWEGLPGFLLAARCAKELQQTLEKAPV